MIRFGEDAEDTHENMQLRRHLRKYEIGKPKRHAGNNRMKHRGEDPNTPPGLDK
jgi:hypothetical protein